MAIDTVVFHVCGFGGGDVGVEPFSVVESGVCRLHRGVNDGSFCPRQICF